MFQQKCKFNTYILFYYYNKCLDLNKTQIIALIINTLTCSKFFKCVASPPHGYATDLQYNDICTKRFFFIDFFLIYPNFNHAPIPSPIKNGSSRVHRIAGRLALKRNSRISKLYTFNSPRDCLTQVHHHHYCTVRTYTLAM